MGLLKNGLYFHDQRIDISYRFNFGNNWLNINKVIEKIIWANCWILSCFFFNKEFLKYLFYHFVT